MSSTSSTRQRTEGPLITGVAADSPAAVAGARVGDEITAVDGMMPRDIIEWQWAIDVENPVISVMRGGLELDLEISKAEGSQLGIDIESAVFDRVRTCDNHCEFCFIHQLPKGMRRSLYLKDDDYRLSFLFGNFTTLTRFTESDLERVIEQRLSPLHVSIHAIDPFDRSRMLKNPRGGMSLRWLRAILDAGIEVKGQIVVCPGVNDGEVLERTMLGVADSFADLSSVAVVPLGISKFNSEPAMRAHTIDEAHAVLATVLEWQKLFNSLVGHPMVFAADEYFLLAGQPFPPIDEYGSCEMHEDGIGMAATFRQEFFGLSSSETSPQRGFFAAVDVGQLTNPAAYTGLRSTPVSLSVTKRSSSSKVTILTGALGAEVIRPLIEESQPKIDVEVLAVQNDFFGGNTGVTGLLTGTDLMAALDGADPDRRYLLPDVCLSDSGQFLDGLSVSDLPVHVEVIPTHGHALRTALGLK